jgi:branched-chain amino acid transport system ATP-binding protein
MLNVENVSVRYGGSEVLHDVSLTIGEGDIIALLGANGSGKTTLINAISGFLPLNGRITLNGTDLTKSPPHRIFAEGIVQVSQMRDLFGKLTVLDNRRLGAMSKRRQMDAATVQQRLDWVLSLFPRLAERAKQVAGTMSGGEQQMLAIGRALMGFPRILLLDEPSGGLAPRFVQEIGSILQTLKREHATVLLVEQNIALAALVADRFYILRSGQVVHEDHGEALKTDAATLGHRFYL